MLVILIFFSFLTGGSFVHVYSSHCQHYTSLHSYVYFGNIVSKQGIINFYQGGKHEISSPYVNAISRQGIKQLASSSGSVC